MPCTAGGTPVTMERLLGLVNEGITDSATRLVPSASMRSMYGISPAAMARSM